MKLALKIIQDDTDLSAECKRMANEFEAAVQWYLAACDATAYRLQWSPLRSEAVKVAA